MLAIAQTADGFIWLGTTGGLLRFDGSVLERYKPEEGSFRGTLISALLATPDGGLWIGYLNGGASFLRSGRVTIMPRRKVCLPAGSGTLRRTLTGAVGQRQWADWDISMGAGGGVSTRIRTHGVFLPTRPPAWQ